MLQGQAIKTSGTISATSGGASGDMAYACGPRKAGSVILVNVSNPSGGAITVNVQVFDAASSTYHTLINGYSLDAGSTLYALANGEQIPMNAGDQIVLHAGSGGSLTYFVAATEVPRTVTG